MDVNLETVRFFECDIKVALFSRGKNGERVGIGRRDGCRIIGSNVSGIRIRKVGCQKRSGNWRRPSTFAVTCRHIVIRGFNGVDSEFPKIIRKRGSLDPEAPTDWSVMNSVSANQSRGNRLNIRRAHRSRCSGVSAQKYRDISHLLLTWKVDQYSRRTVTNKTVRIRRDAIAIRRQNGSDGRKGELP